MSEKLTEELLDLMRRFDYSEKVIDYINNKVNMGRMDPATGSLSTQVPAETCCKSV